ncbi:BolA family protein [Gallaecimonas sp. GXIMD1310]|uniref:BolA family protein n=1 Tax=Gallaecimonas sp. GXIMD1310 TaxID=3131926 RepID=UPI00324A4D66
MSVAARIENTLQATFAPQYLSVINESHMHGGPATESHFKVVLVSAQFAGQRLLSRHRAVNKALAGELANGVHALALHTYSPEEWRSEHQQVPDSPACRGGSAQH